LQRFPVFLFTVICCKLDIEDDADDAPLVSSVRLMASHKASVPKSPKASHQTKSPKASHQTVPRVAFPETWLWSDAVAGY